jgi:exodeoxyribonuclease VII large subunit
MNPLSISALTTHIVSLFEVDETLRDVWVIGEVSNWKRAASGHAYFSLKDDGASIACVMWKGNLFGQSWLPRDGDQVMVHGYVGVYPPRGAYQFYADQIRPAGRGQLYLQFEELKARLAQTGLFEPDRKRPVPMAARRIGVVTSADAAALRDVLRVLSQRWPLVEVILFSTLVQGNEAPPQIVAALEAANRYSQTVEPLDVLLLVRGGGSIEDLWAFNDERVAHAVADSRLPIIAGVGHETDFTIVDFVADLRMPTPSAAAAAPVPDRGEVLGYLANLQHDLVQAAQVTISSAQDRLGQARARLQRVHPRRQLDMRRQSLDDRLDRLQRAMGRQLVQRRERLSSANHRLDALSPANVLARGYSIVQRRDGSIVAGPADTASGERLTVRARDGEYRVRTE